MQSTVLKMKAMFAGKKEVPVFPSREKSKLWGMWAVLAEQLKIARTSLYSLFSAWKSLHKERFAYLCFLSLSCCYTPNVR